MSTPVLCRRAVRFFSPPIHVKKDKIVSCSGRLCAKGCFRPTSFRNFQPIKHNKLLRVHPAIRERLWVALGVYIHTHIPTVRVLPFGRGAVFFPRSASETKHWPQVKRNRPFWKQICAKNLRLFKNTRGVTEESE